MLRALALLAAVFVSTHAIAQDKEPVSHIRLEFVIKEVDGSKVINSRAFSAQTSTAHGAPNASIRTGNKVPVVNGIDGTYNYIEVGASIDCMAPKIEDGQLSIYVAADISSLPQDPPQDNPTGKVTMKPTIRQNKWGGQVLVPFKKPTVLFSSDDLTTKHQMQLELTATQIK